MSKSTHEWPRVTTSDHEWPRATTSDHEWPRMTTSEKSENRFSQWLTFLNFFHSWSLVVTHVLLDMIISFWVSFIHYVIILRVSYSIPHLEEFLKWLLFILIVLWKIFLRNYLKQGTYIINVGMHIILVLRVRGGGGDATIALHIKRQISHGYIWIQISSSSVVNIDTTR